MWNKRSKKKTLKKKSGNIWKINHLLHCKQVEHLIGLIDQEESNELD